jgi:predicted Fe-Mo cluster-binding NifX family protein
VIYDTESKATEFVPNSNKENIEGAGPASVQTVAERGVKKVVSGEFGAKVKSIFDRYHCLLRRPETSATNGVYLYSILFVSLFFIVNIYAFMV